VENTLLIHDAGQSCEIFMPQSRLLTIVRDTPTLWQNFNVQVGCTCNAHGVYSAYDSVSVIVVEKHKKNIVKSKPFQPAARDSFTFAAEIFEMSKFLLNLSRDGTQKEF
jgi:hypothetical protein